MSVAMTHSSRVHSCLSSVDAYSGAEHDAAGPSWTPMDHTAVQARRRRASASAFAKPDSGRTQMSLIARSVAVNGPDVESAQPSVLGLLEIEGHLIAHVEQLEVVGAPPLFFGKRDDIGGTVDA